MSYDFFSLNGQVLPISEAVVPLDNIAYTYGYGVYETIRIHGGIAFFAAEHFQRLMLSAEIIRLAHDYTPQNLAQNLQALLQKNETPEANAKLLLIGGRTSQDANLYMQLLNPLYPDRKLYKVGAHATSEQYERLYPQAKTLNMLPSYLAYQKAQAAGAYDALLVNRHGEITEGTRTNFLALQNRTLFTAPDHTILSGVMRKAVLLVAAQQGFQVKEQAIHLDDLASYEAAFMTSTSTKIMPLHSIDTHEFGETPENLKELMTSFVTFYDQCSGILPT